jgi:beta-lactamase regulating signal transducer with metallopeptidase domain
VNELFHSLSFVSAGASSALLAAIWQGAVLCAAVAICLRLLPGLSAAARSVVWFNVFVLVLLLHTVPAFTPRVPALSTGNVPAIHLDLRWSLAIAGLWLSLSLWRAVQFVLGAIHLRRLAGRAEPVPVDAELKALLAGVPRGRTAVLCASDEVARPSVLGFFRPSILVPSVLLQRLSPTELQQVVLHEMEHLRRADDWTNLLQKIGLVLFPLNPVLLWVERRLCAERELACDDRVLRSSAGRKAYALCLAHLAEYAILRRSFSLVLGAWEQRPELVRRVHRILSQPVRAMGRRPAMAATGGLLAGALGCALALSHSPRLVSFVPGHQSELQAQSLDPHEVARALGGTPQLMKANLPAQPDLPAAKHKAVRQAVVKHTKPRHPAPNRIASLEAPQTPLPDLDRRTLVVLTEWTTYQVRPRVVPAFSNDQPAARPVLIPAKFAIVPTPTGWLIIQI